MWSEWLQSPLFSLTLTIGIYVLAQGIYRRTSIIIFNPVALAIAGIIAVLLTLHIPYETYDRGGRYLLFLLGPAVVALGVPLYQRRQEIVRRKVPILAGVAAGALTSVITASGTAWLLGASASTVRSMAPKSVTTPIAIGIADKIGGISPLTAAIVVATGCLGGMCGPEFCRMIGIRSPASMGLAVGTAAHGIGTARMLEIDRLGGAIAGLAIGLNGLVTAVLVPLLFIIFPV